MVTSIGKSHHENIAILSNVGDIVSFSYKDTIIKYKGPYSLQYFSKVNKYDNGYVEVMCKFSHNDELVEDYIDFENIASELYMDTTFLTEIDEVRCEHV